MKWILLRLKSATKRQLPLALRGVAVILQFASVAVCGHVAGAEAVGVLGAFNAWSRVVVIGVLAGYPVTAVREFAPVAAALSRQDGRHWTSVVVRRAIAAGGVTAALALSIAAVTGYDVILVLSVVGGGLILGLARSVSVLRQCLGDPHSVIAMDFTLPALSAFAAVGILAASGGLNAANLTVGLGLTTLAVLAYALLSLRRLLLNLSGHGVPKARINAALDLRSNATVGISRLTTAVVPAAPYLVLFPLGDEYAGAYTIAARIAGLSSILIGVVSASAMPKFAAAAADRNVEAFQSLYRRSTAFVTCAFLPVMLLCIAVPEQVVGIFGLTGNVAETFLVIVVASQLVNSITGLSWYRLLILGGEVFSIFAACISVAVLLFGLVLLGPHGPLWAAVAAALGQPVRNLMEAWAGHRRLQRLRSS